MTLQDLGNLGEFVGAIGVIVTLAYLAVQIRQSSLSTRANIRQAIAGQQIAYINGRGTDPALRTGFRKMANGEELTPDEQQACTFHSIAGIRLFESYHAQHAAGIFGEKDWAAMRQVMKNAFALPMYRELFLGSGPIWNADFSKVIGGILAEIGESSSPSEAATARIREIVIDALNPAALARFWAAALEGYSVRAYDEAEIARLAGIGRTPETDPAVALDGPGPTIFLQKSAAPKTDRNRVHLDLVGVARPTEVERLCGLGATVRDEHDTFTVLRDPEGNEFCVLDPE